MNQVSSASPLQDQAQTYESNPFNLLVKGNERLFKVNQTAAIVLVVIGALLGMLQFGIELFRLFIKPFSEEPSPRQPLSASFTQLDGSGMSLTFILVFAAILLAALFFVFIFSTLWNAFYKGTLAYIAACTLQNKKASIGEGISILGKNFWQFLIASFLVQLKVIGGFLLFIIPGIRAALRYDLVYIAIIIKNQRATEAMRFMKAITKGRLIEIFGVKTLASFVPFVSNVIELGGRVAQYDQLAASYKNPAMHRTKVHWLNWLAFYLVGAFVLLIAFSAAVIGIILSLGK